MLGVRQFFLGFCFITAVCAEYSCRKTSEIKTAVGKPEVLIADKEQRYPYNRLPVVHLSKDTVYILGSDFTRESGEQLIIDAGTLIKVNTTASTGGTLNSGIYIRRGAIIQALGAPEKPIVFTSGDFTGNQQLNWAGITIEGASFDNAQGNTGDATDFSGTLSYVRIEFAPLVLRGIGNRTIIENIQVSYSNPQSAFEIDGGTFNARHLVSYACGGPVDFYITRGYVGKLQGLLAYRHPFFGTAGSTPPGTLAGMVIENNPDPSAAPTAKPFTFPVISNLSLLGPGMQSGVPAAYFDTTIASAALVTTRSACFRMRNCVFFGFPAAGWYLDDFATASYLRDSVSEFTHSLVQCDNRERLFYLKPDVLPPYTSAEFKSYMLQDRFANAELDSISSFGLTDLTNYDKGPDPTPKAGSPVFGHAAFDGPTFGDSFFERTDYVGALGAQNWMRGWVNFTPLKTNYNFPH